ncbi:MAG TPA: hypothetical protein VMF57_03795 [Solirubrobacteraceae bacterium]|nr:hypothetical protein [Solirubrobacteraceae bacterium]HTX10566.1 hypothetical protein [Solirubrobacteraceae bacterium]
MRSSAQLNALIDELTVDCYNDEEQETGFQVGAEEALVRGERARLAGHEFEVRAVIHGPDVRTGLRARVRGEDRGTHEVALSDLEFPNDSELGTVVAAYRRWLGWR